MADNLTSKTLHGLKWSYTGTIINSILQVGFTAIMARLLDPSDFGLMAMVAVILRFGTYFSQMGVGSAIIQKKEVSNEDIRASFTSSFLLGILFTIIVLLYAPLATYIFDNEKIVSIIRVMAISFFISGLSTTALSLLRRNLAFRKLAVAEIFSYVIGYGLIGILLAYKGFGVWSLVAGSLSQSIILAVLAYCFCQHRLSFIFRWKYYKPLYSFGGRVSIISFFEFLGSNLDTLAIGHFIGAGSLGIYNRAFMLINLPMYYFTTSFSRVLFPSFSRVQKEVDRLKKAYLSTIMLFSAILLPSCLGISVSSREIVLLVLGGKWVAAIPVLQILAVAAFFSFISHFGGVTCDATATLNIKLLMQTIYVIILGILFYLMRGLSIREFAVAIVSAEFIRYVAYLFIVKQICNIKPMEYVYAYLPSIVSALIIGPSIYFLASILREFDTPIVLLFAIEFISGGGLLIIMFFYGPQQLLRKEVKERFDLSGIVINNNSVVDRLVYWFYKTLSTN